ncbi:MAG TPA: MFS transporter [Candidatus Paceibacterota bacterium]|nr:MFS transporter [Candidatus Paceibacterota bacterium]
MQPQKVLWLGNFFSAAHFFLIVLVVGPYLTTFLGAEAAGLVVSVGAIITLLLFPLMPALVAKKGAKKLAVGLGFLQAVVLTVLAGNPTAAVAIVCVALACAISPLIAYQLDLLLEATVKEEGETGRIRTAFITAGNIALLAAPLIIGLALNGTDRYDFAFFAAAISLTPFIMLFLVEKLPEGAPPRPSKLRATATCMFRDPDMRAVALGSGTLQVFFHLAPLYVPIYLHTVLGMPWDQLGWMFAIAVLPFILLEYPAGYLADRYLGDRKLLVTGFVIMGLSFASLALVTAATPVYLILLVMLLTRVGAALAEAMVEGHFFRRVTERDASTVSVFRMMRPGGALIAPIMGSLLLVFGGYSMLFVVMGLAIALVGSVSALAMRDVRYDATENLVPALSTSPSSTSAASA